MTKEPLQMSQNNISFTDYRVAEDVLIDLVDNPKEYLAKTTTGAKIFIIDCIDVEQGRLVKENAYLGYISNIFIDKRKFIPIMFVEDPETGLFKIQDPLIPLDEKAMGLILPYLFDPIKTLDGLPEDKLLYVIGLNLAKLTVKEIREGYKLEDENSSIIVEGGRELFNINHACIYDDEINAYAYFDYVKKHGLINLQHRFVKQDN